MVIQLRIDERLIHGQIAAAWAKHLDFSHIICASDDASQDELRKRLLLTAAPAGKKAFVKPVDETIKLLDDPRADKMKVFVITDSPENALKLVKALKIKDVNVANYHKRDATQKVTVLETFVIDRDQVSTVEELISVSEDIYTQMLPTVSKVDFVSLFNKAK